MQSGFEMEIKRHWLGQEWYLPGAAGNEINKVSTQAYKDRIVAHSFSFPQTNVPNIRLAYRHQTLTDELSMLREASEATVSNNRGDTDRAASPGTLAARAMATR